MELSGLRGSNTGVQHRLLMVALGVLAASVAVAEQVGSGSPGQVQITGPPPLPAPAPVDGTAALSGVVTDGATNRPLGGVTVSLGMDRPAGMLRPPPLSQTITDDKGRFVFWPVSPGAGYFVNATAFGYFDGGYGRTPTNTVGRRITLTDRQWFERADFAMWRPGAIAGRVLDEHGEPVVGVMVRVMRQVHVAGRPQLASGQNAPTDDRGAYRFGGLAPGRYFVVVPSTQMAAPEAVIAPMVAKLAPGAATSTISPPTTADAMLDVDGTNRLVVGRFAIPPVGQDGRMLAYPVTWYPGTATVTSATAIDVDDGSDRAGIDIRLQPVAASRVSGVVQGAAGLTGNLTLRLMPAGSESLGLGSEAATALVAPDGAFTFLNVPSGEYVIDARGTITEYESDAGGARYNLPLPPGMVSSGGSATSIASGTPGTGMTTIKLGTGDKYWGRLPITVGDREVANLAVTLNPTITIRGRIVYEGTAQPSMRPFVIAEPADGNASMGQPWNAAEQGNMEALLLEGLMPGEYFLRVRVQDGWTVKSIVTGARDYSNAPFDASAGRDFNDVTITLTDRRTTVEGAVSTADGSPSAGAAVIAFPAERGQWSNYGQTPLRIKATRVTNVGTYRLTGLPAGDYLVVAVDESQFAAWHDPAFLEAAAASASRVSLGWGGSSAQNLRIVEVRTR
jgi:hypothetical protein